MEVSVYRRALQKRYRSRLAVAYGNSSRVEEE
jgi:hypothetical protein